MNKLIVLPLLFLMHSCSNYGQLTFVTKLPKNLKENSGIVSLDETSVWLVEDGGNPDKIYEVDFDGNAIRDFKVKNAKNKDWEDLAMDKEGNVYIGDFGNNNSKRKDLVIYKIPNPEIEPGDKIDAERIEFSYPEQTDYSPKKKGLLYDSEAFFYFDGYLYIITKNRTKPFTGTAFIYKVPAKKGEHKAQLISEFTTCNDPYICEITSADISPNGKTIALLGYGKLWIYSNFKWDDFSQGNQQIIDLGATTQLESLCFKDNNTLLISDEERGNTGRNLYRYALNN